MQDTDGKVVKLKPRRSGKTAAGHLTRESFERDINIGALPMYKRKFKFTKRTLRTFRGGTLTHRRYGCTSCQKFFHSHETVLTYPTSGRQRSCPICGELTIREGPNIKRAKAGRQ